MTTFLGLMAEIGPLLKRADEDARGTRCLTMAEVTQCLNAMRQLEPLVKELLRFRIMLMASSNPKVEISVVIKELDRLLGEPVTKAGEVADGRIEVGLTQDNRTGEARMSVKPARSVPATVTERANLVLLRADARLEHAGVTTFRNCVKAEMVTEFALLQQETARVRAEVLEEAAKKCLQDFDDEEVRKVTEGTPVYRIIHERIAALKPLTAAAQGQPHAERGSEEGK